MTQFVGFLFSSAGVICLSAVALLCLRKRPPGSRLYPATLTLVGFYFIASIYPVSHAASRLLTRGLRPFAASDVRAGRNVLVVLGSGSNIARDSDGLVVSLASQTGMERVAEAARVYRLIQPEWVIASGGRVYSDDPSSASAETARDLLLDLGVPDSRILLETRAKTTHEEAAFIARTIEQLKADGVVVVTSDLHMPRAKGAFRAEGINIIPAIAGRVPDRAPWNLDVIPSDTGLDETGAVAREVLGIGYYFVRGWYKRP